MVVPWTGGTRFEPICREVTTWTELWKIKIKRLCTICSVWMAVLDEDNNFHRIHRSAEVSFKSCLCESLLEPMKVFINNVL